MKPNVAAGLAMASAFLIGVVAGHFHGVADTLGDYVDFKVAMMEKLDD